MKKLKDEVLFRSIHDFIKIYLPKQKCCSPNTIKAYREALNLLFDFITQEKHILMSEISFQVINRQMVSDYLDWLEQKRHCSISTRNHRLACIRSFFKYAGNMDLTLMTFQSDIKKVPLKNNTNAKTIDFLSESALKAVLEQPNTESKTGIRDLFFMILMYDTGARDMEILDLKIRDFQDDSKTPCVYLTGKGNKKRTVPVMPKTVKHFQNYIKVYHAESSPDQYLFYTVRHGIIQPMSDDNVARFMKIYGKAAKEICNEFPNRLHPHMFRHTRAMHLYRAGMPLALLSEWLGHAQLETTMIYAYADTEMKRDAIQKATGTSNPLTDRSLLPYWKDNDELIRKLYGLK